MDLINKKLQPMLDLAIWSFLQPHHQEANIKLLKESVNELIQMTTQKTAGQRTGSKDLSFDNLDRVQFTIICEAVALVLSGKLDAIE